MNYVQHPSNNRVLGAPTGWDQNALPCSALPVTDTVQDGVAGVASFWRPDADELKALQAGGLVVLNVIGRTMPPVQLLVVAPEQPL